MADSQVLIYPGFVRFHTHRTSDMTQELAFPFLVVHEGETDSGGDQKFGWVFCHDEDNNAGLSVGLNWRADIGHGGPGADVSWSAFSEEA